MNLLRSVIALTTLLTVLTAGALIAACGGDDSSPSSPGVEQRQTASEQEQPITPDAEATQTVAQQSQAVAQQAQDQTGDQQGTLQVQAEQESKPQSSEEVRAEDVDEGIPPLAVEPILGGYRFEQPIEMIALPDGSFLVAEQRGSITRFVEQDGELQQFGVLDLSDDVTFGGERGLLSVALDPDFEAKPYLYVYYSPRDTDLSRLSRFEMQNGAALPDSELTIIEFEQPFSNHNGGAVRFGPDGMLYLGLGDGGAANDPLGHGQNTQTLLGAIIRIDVDDISATTPYRIPTDNPFLGRSGFRPETWAYGLRNPWRMAFDPQTDLLWVGDVGQNQVEEIAIVQAGQNHGWNVFEGDQCFRSDEECEALPDAVAPVAVYGHDEGCSVTGGMHYQGEALQHLVGAYVFGDYCSGTIWALWPDHSADTGWWRVTLLESDRNIASFAVDNDGEIHVLTFNGPILKLVLEER